MLWHRQALRDEQARQSRIETVGEDLLLIAVTSLYAQQQQGAAETGVWDLAEEVFHEASLRVKHQIRELLLNHDTPPTILGTKALSGTYPSLSKGIIERNLEDYRMRVHAPAHAQDKQEHATV
jgi:hypothetical protein